MANSDAWIPRGVSASMPLEMTQVIATRKPAAGRGQQALPSPSALLDDFEAPPERPVPRQPRQHRPRAAEPASPEPVELAPRPSSEGVERWREAARIVVVMIGAGVLLALIHHSPIGQGIASALDWSAYALPPALIAVGLDALRRLQGARPLLRFEEFNGILALFLAVLVATGAPHHGGPIGNALADELTRTFGLLGVPLAGVFLTALGLVLAFHVTTGQALIALRSCLRVLGRTGHAGGRASAFALRGAAGSIRQRVRGKVRAFEPDEDADADVIDARVISVAEATGAPAPILASTPPAPDTAPRVKKQHEGKTAKGARSSQPTTAPAAPPRDLEDEVPWEPPPLSLLQAAPPTVSAPLMDTDGPMQLIEDTLASFNVKARVVSVHTGPTVTRYDVQPERGVRVARIVALQNDLALALAARTIRMQAPVPGQSVLGIEIPNAKTSLVTLREILESEVCRGMKSALKIALGKDVSGTPVVADLAKMPHLLIAGSTGSGKSVCLNSLISSLLFHNSPERLRLLMVDPKMVELTVFNGVPHLLAPVVTDVTKVTNTLKWALKEMHRRYKLFAERGARNLARYNEMQWDPKKKLPFIVIVIDELADLMMVAPEDIEDSICRLAQLARATGMHLVIATQRPSVDVITGLIKANFPARIAFAVSSMVDSRTILDSPGAEKLLGRGDMLYQPADEGKPTRVQGTYLSDTEIEELVAFWKGHGHHEVERIPEAELEADASSGGSGEESNGDEKLLQDATRVLREYKRASVSLLQRRLSIGYTRAARLLDMLEDRGVVGPSEDGRSRVVLEIDDDGARAEHAGPEQSEDEDDEMPPL